MVKVICPLSNSKNVEKLETILIDDIKRLYLRNLNINLESEIIGIDSVDLYHCLDSDLIFFSPAITGSEAFYEALQRRYDYYMDEKDEYDYACQWIRPTDHVLEIGCGKAAFSDRLSTPDYCGLEFSQKAIEMAKSKGRDVRLESIQDHSNHSIEMYDVVCAFQVLEHVSELDEFIRSSIACLKPNGILIYSTPSLDSFARKVTNFALDMPPHHVTRWSDKALKNISHYHPIEHIEIWHEPLQAVHQSFYLDTIIMSAFSRRLNRSFKTIDFRMSTKLLAFVSHLFTRLILPGLTDENHFPAGQTVVSVYRKSS
jgi:2-polyprenyl-3-methyl-5-hydroxy-6-metoxy-1,4-benzoquinol methylase